jgi:hypothetical protein
VHTFKNGEIWMGSFKDDVMQKDCVLVTRDSRTHALQSRYEGEMKQEAKGLSLRACMPEAAGSSPDAVQYVAHGYGSMLYRSVARYDGSWKLGKRHGQGTLTWLAHPQPQVEPASDKGKQVMQARRCVLANAGLATLFTFFKSTKVHILTTVGVRQGQAGDARGGGALLRQLRGSCRCRGDV